MMSQAFDLVVRNGTVATERGAVTGCVAGTEVAADRSGWLPASRRNRAAARPARSIALQDG